MQPKNISGDNVLLLRHTGELNSSINSEKATNSEFKNQFQTNDENASQLNIYCDNSNQSNSVESLNHNSVEFHSNLNSEYSSRTESENYKIKGLNSDVKNSNSNSNAFSQIQQNKNFLAEMVFSDITCSAADNM